MTVTLTPEQERAVEAFDPVHAGDVERVTIGGYAGTGKTTVIAETVRRYPRTVVCTPTGKAAHVLRQKGVDAMTLHSLIYRPRQRRDGSVTFTLNEDDEMPRCVIVDEASMLSTKLVEDLEQQVWHVMYVGDHGQLEPVGDDPGLMQSPDIRLETIHRQALGSPIIVFAHELRRGKSPRHLAYNDPRVRVQYGWSRDLAECDVVLVGYNDTRVKVNRAVRKIRGYAGPLPEVGESVICLRNDRDAQVWNGMTATITAIDASTKRLSVETDDGPRNDLPFDPRQFGHPTTLPYIKHRAGRKPPPTLWDFGYALTVHKCVAGSTLIETDDGWQRIDTVQAPTGKVAACSGKLVRYSGLIQNPATELLSITCEGGYCLTATSDHRIRRFVSGDWLPVTAGELNIGDFLRLRLGDCTHRPEQARLPEAFAPDVRARVVSFPTHLSEEMAEWLGLMVADGTVFRGGVRLAKRHVDVVERFAYLGEQLFKLPAKPCMIGSTHAVQFNSSHLASWLQQLGGMLPHAKSIPACVLASPASVRAKFLQGLFADGTVNVKDDKVDHIELSSHAPGMLAQLQTLLLEYGIICTLSYKSHCLYIYSSSVTAFKQHIGFVSRFKQQRLDLPISRSLRQRVPIDYNALPPGVIKQRAKRRGYISRHAAEQLGLAEALDYHYVRITHIGKTRGPSYCLTVPELGSFLQNRFDGMNSQGSEWRNVAVVDEVSTLWSPERWRYTAATRASETLRWVFK